MVFVRANAQTIPTAAEMIIEKSPVARTDMSIWVGRANEESEPLVDLHSDVSRTPASVAKIITTGMGLLLLGYDYEWRTNFYADGLIENGVLNGNLYIKGQGNPYLVEERLREMVIELRDKGIDHIAGNVILDSSYFIKRKNDPNAFDGFGFAAYNALPHAMNINFRTAKMVFEIKGSQINISTKPELQKMVINNKMTLNNRSCKGKGFAPQLAFDETGEALVVSGTMSKHCKKQDITQVFAEPGDLFFGYFQLAWELLGGTMRSNWRYGQPNENATLLYSSSSRPLLEQISAMNKLSNNVMTRQLFLTLGAELTQPPATLTKARAVIKHRLQRMGINVSGMFLDNGSGLSRTTRITARQLGQFLRSMYQDKRVADDFQSSLSLVGVDGTLKRRLRGTPLAGNAKGKTGTIDGVKSLAGYLTAKSGTEIAYVVLLEGAQAKTGRPLMDDLMLWLYDNY